VAKLLLVHGADVNARDKHGETPLLGACRLLGALALGRHDLVEELRARGAK